MNRLSLNDCDLYTRGINVDTGMKKDTNPPEPAKLTLPDGTELTGMQVLEHYSKENLYLRCWSQYAKQQWCHG